MITGEDCVGSVKAVTKFVKIFSPGLYDTVLDVDNDKERAQAQGLEPNGFSFEGTDAGGVDYALNRAIFAWFDACVLESARPGLHGALPFRKEITTSWEKNLIDWS